MSGYVVFSALGVDQQKPDFPALSRDAKHTKHRSCNCRIDIELSLMLHLQDLTLTLLLLTLQAVLQAVLHNYQKMRLVQNRP